MIPNRCLLLFTVSVILLSSSISLAQPGLYESRSESEWEITLRLKEDGYAIKTHENWLAGEYDRRDTYINRGKWVSDGDIITVQYAKKIDKYRMVENVKMRKGYVIGTCPLSLVEIGETPHRLWLKKCLKFELPE